MSPPKRKRNAAPPKRILIVLAVCALLVFVVGEAVFLTRSDAGALTLARLGLVDRPRTTQIMGRQLHRALDAMRVSRDSLSERVGASGPATVHWRVGLTPDASGTQIHAAIAQALADQQATVLSGRESRRASGETSVTLVVGVGRYATHELQIVHAARAPEADAEPAAGSIALVLFGLGDEAETARDMFALPAPFAVAIAPGGKSSAQQFKLARQLAREVVLHVPLEPINYPSINPGEGTILVTMTASQVSGRMKRYLDQSDGAIAVSNHLGSLATQDMTVMTALFKELKRAQLPFVHVLPAPGAVCKSLAADLGVVYDQPDAVIDSEARQDKPKALDATWKTLLAEAREGRYLTVWVRATPLTRTWLTKIQDPKRLNGVSLVPLSSVLRRPGGVVASPLLR